jgi:tRNA wybutosine-synthesizing protein 3
MFDHTKQVTLIRSDRSKRGSVDRQIRPLLKIINAHPDLYTTSSCAGRISLLCESRRRKKDETNWLYVTHGRAAVTDVLRALEKLPRGHVSLRMEPFIIHVAARTIAIADRVLDAARMSGCKHSGIIAAKERVMIEIYGNEQLCVPVAYRNKIIVTQEYLGHAVREANTKLRHSRIVMRRLTDELRRI